MIDLAKIGETMIVIKPEYKEITKYLSILKLPHKVEEIEHLIFQLSTDRPNILFGLLVKPEIIYLITLWLKQNGYFFHLFLNYSKDLDNSENSIYIGTCLEAHMIDEDKKFTTNVSKAINVDIIFSNNFLQYTILDYIYNFPCCNIDTNGKLGIYDFSHVWTDEEYREWQDEQDFNSSLEPNSYYDDNLDLDQQDESFYETEG